MMMISQASMTVPNDICLYLFTMAAIISVPPVEPLFAKQRYKPIPSVIPPSTHAINVSSPRRRGKTRCPLASTSAIKP